MHKNWKIGKRRLNSIFIRSEITLPTKSSAASPQAAWDQGQETYPMSSRVRNGTAPTFRTHTDGSEVQHLYLALQCTCSSAVLCIVKIYCPPPHLPLNSESGMSSRTDPGFWYIILHSLLNTNSHHSSTLSHRIITYRSAAIFCGVSAVSQMTS